MVHETTLIRYTDLIHQDRADNTPIAWRKERLLTVGDLRHHVTHLTHILQRRSEQYWALCIEDSFLFAASLLALIYAHKTPVILGHTRPKLLAEQKKYYDALLSDIDLPVELIEEEHYINLHNLPEQPDITTPFLLTWHADTVLHLFTSGSTSEPKIIKKTIEYLEKESHLLAEQFARQFANTRVIATVSHLHLYGLTFKIFLSLTLELPFDADIQQFQEGLPTTPDKNRQQKYLLITSPAFLKRMDDQLISTAFQGILSAGGKLEFNEAQCAKNILGTLPIEIYGSSETGVIAYRQQEDAAQAFKPFNAVKVSQLKDQTIAIESPLFDINMRPELNDLIELCAHGFYIKGRLGKVVKIEEKRISLTEVETRIMSQNEIDSVAVITLEQGRRTILAAVIVLKSPITVEDEQTLINKIKQNLQLWLEPIAVPKRWRIVKSLPVNSQGKQSYLDLKALFS